MLRRRFMGDQDAVMLILDHHHTVVGAQRVIAINALIGFRGLMLQCYPRGVTHWCSSATTLIMNGLEFGGQELSKRPDMISQSSSHARSSVAPLGLDQS